MKPVDSFAKRSASPDGLQNNCKECQKAYRREYYMANKEKSKVTSAKWREENSESIREQKKFYYENNREKFISLNREWRKENPDKVNAHSAKRRASKLQRTPEWLTDFDKEMIDWTYHCAKVATEKFGEPYHVDHIIPLQGENVSGLHVPGNLQVIPATENFSKGNSYCG